MAFGQIGRGFGGSESLVQHIPLTTNGGMLYDDANTISHVYFNGTQLVDTKGLAWIMEGTVPQTHGGWNYDGQTQRPSAGPYTALTNLYYLGTGTALDFTGSWTAMFLIDEYSATSVGTVFSSENNSFSGGWQCDIGGGEISLIDRLHGITLNNPPAGNAYVGGHMVIGYGFDSVAGTMYTSLNGSVVTGVTTAGSRAAVGSNPTLGGITFYAVNAFQGSITEAYFTAASPTTTFFQSTTTRLLGNLSAEGQVLTMVRL